MIFVYVMKFFGENLVCLVLVFDKVWSVYVGLLVLKGELIRFFILVKFFLKQNEWLKYYLLILRNCLISMVFGKQIFDLYVDNMNFGFLFF